MKNKTKMLIVALDGATFDIIQPLIEQGKLPNLARLMSEGAWGKCRSTVPPMTFPAWSSFLTGCNPGKHGIYDFTKFRPNSYEVRFINARHRKRPTFFRILSEAGYRVAMIGVPTTYPPEPLNGVVISGFDSPVTTSMDPSFVYPKSIFFELKKQFGAFHNTGFQETRIGSDWHYKALKKMQHNLQKRLQISLYLLNKGGWDCFMTLFGQTDTVSHHFWAFHDSNSPRYVPTATAYLGDAINSIYQQADQALGELIKAAGEEVPVLVLSDHGFGGAGDRVLYLNQWLSQQGFLSFKKLSFNNRFFKMLRIKTAEYLPAKFQQQLFRRFGSFLVGAVESCSRFGNIDWSRTKVFSDELNYFPRFFINQKSRFPQGIVQPGREYEKVCEDLKEALLKWKDPSIKDLDATSVVEKVQRPEVVYSGAYLEEAPDLIPVLALPDGYSYTCLTSSAEKTGEIIRKIKPQEYLGAKGHGMNGSHRQDGIVLFNNFGFPQSKKLQKFHSLQDLAPIILDQLGFHQHDWT